MRDEGMEPTWPALLAPRLALPLGVLLGGVLLHSMNVLITATLLPSIVADVGGANLMSWPTTAFVANEVRGKWQDAQPVEGIVAPGIEEGATIVRIGRAVFGDRPPKDR